MKNLNAIPGQRIEVPIGNDAGFPVHIKIGSVRQPAWIEKHKRYAGIEVTAWVACPDLGEGEHDLIVYDSRGPHPVGVVSVRPSSS